MKKTILAVFVLVCSISSVAIAQPNGQNGVFADLYEHLAALEARLEQTSYEVAELEARNVALNATVVTLSEEVVSLEEIQMELLWLQNCHAQGGSGGRSFGDFDEDGAPDYEGFLGVNWNGCNKSGIQLWGTLHGLGGNSVNSELVNADLRFVNFSGASLIGVEMQGANLHGANFTNANLHYSDLTGANIVDYDDNGSSTIFDNTRCPDGTNSDDNGGTCSFNRTYP